MLEQLIDWDKGAMSLSCPIVVKLGTEKDGHRRQSYRVIYLNLSLQNFLTRFEVYNANGYEDSE